jgi:hypothetical protein
MEASLVKAREELGRRGWGGLLFAGYFFKGYCQDVPAEGSDPVLLKQIAEGLRLIDVPTTTGPGTGNAVTVEEVVERRRLLPGGGWPLAVASGVTGENVGPLLPHVTCFLVGTGVEQEVDDPQVAAFYRVRPFFKKMFFLPF